MERRSRKVFIVCLALIVCGVVPALSQPQSVPRFTERPLDKASYVELAREWKKYIEENGETADALVNLGRAYDYSEEQDAALVAARRAVELEPDDPGALAFLGKMLAVWAGDEEGALEVLERCTEIAPDHKNGLIMLATVHMRRGELGKSEEVFKAIFDQRVISAPLQDFGYNMLVGLPDGAVLITNGDHDTFPPLALQAGMDFRKDVIVINRSLLNLPGYAEGIFKRYPSIKPDYEIDPEETAWRDENDQIRILSNALVEKMIEEQKAPVYFSAGVNLNFFGFTPEVFIKGLNLRTTDEGLTAEESAQLFLNTYRMDSATDWNFAWSLYTSVSRLLSNYVTSMIKIAEEKDVKEETRKELLEKALEIATFHDLDRMSYYIKSIQDK